MNGAFDMICCGCGKTVRVKDAKGSMKHPYCKKCYKKRFKNDEEYIRFLKRTHPFA